MIFFSMFLKLIPSNHLLLSKAFVMAENKIIRQQMTEIKVMESEVKGEAIFKKGMKNIVKKAHKHSGITGDHVIILAYSPSGKPFFYDSATNSNTIARSSVQKLKNFARGNVKASAKKDH